MELLETSSGHQEDFPVVIPALPASANFTLGSGWDCRNFVPVSLSEENIAKLSKAETETYILPIKTLDYSLKYIRNTTTKTMTLSVGLGMEAKILMGIVITIGSAQYKSTHQTEMKKENLQIYYYREECVERLLPSQTVKNAVKCSLGDKAETDATHIVTEVVSGAHIVADIIIETKETTKLVNKSSAGLGSLILGPLSAGLEAGLSALLDKPGKDVKISYEVECSHPEILSSNVTSVTEIFEAIKKIGDATPVPIKLRAVPLSQFSDVGEKEKLYKMIGNHILQQLTDMIKQTTDYKVRDYYPKLVTHEDIKLRNMMDDPQSPIRLEFENKIKDYPAVAERCHFEGSIALDALSTGGIQDIEEQILAILSDYRENFNLQYLEESVRTSATEGKKQLALINADDIDETVAAIFIASQNTFDNYEAKEPIHLILKTGQNSLLSDDEPRGAFLSVYELSKVLQVFVFMPNVSGNEFSLTVIVGNDKNSYVGNDILNVLQLLSVAKGITDGSTIRFYQAVASLATVNEENAIALPIEEDDMLETLPKFITLFQSWTDVSIFKTPMSLRAYLTEQEATETFTFCIPVECLLSLGEGIKEIQSIREITKSHEWIVGSFDLLLDEGPLLIIYKGGKPVLASFDKLDILALKTRIEQNEDLSNLPKTNSNYFEHRQTFYKELESIVNVRLVTDEADSSMMGGNSSSLVINMAIFENVHNVFQICAAYLSLQDRNKKMLDAVCKQATFKFPTLTPAFEIHGWSMYAKKFILDFYQDVAKADSFKDAIQKQMFGCSEALATIGSFIHTINFTIEEREIEEGEEKPPERNFEHVTNMKDKMYNTISKFDPELAASLSELINELSNIEIEEEEKVEKCKEMKALIENMLQTNGRINEDENELLIYLQQILILLPKIEDEEEEDGELPPTHRNWKVTDEPQLLQILKYYFHKELELEESEEWIALKDKRLIPIVIAKLERLQYQTWFNNLLSAVQGLNFSNDLIGLERILTVIKDIRDSENKEEEERERLLRFIWKNEVMTDFIYEAMDSSEFFDVAVAKICIGESNQVPLYIPVKIRRKIVDKLGQEEEEDNGEIGNGDNDPMNPVTWNNVSDALKMMQTTIALKVRLPSPRFMKILRQNLGTKLEIKDAFLEANALFFWDDKINGFEESWDESVTREAIERIRNQKMLNEDLQFSPVEFSTINMEVDEDAFVDYIRNNFAGFQVKILANLQKWINAPTSVWNDLWEEDSAYKQLMTRFLSLLEKEQSNFNRVNGKLSLIFQESCEFLIKELLELQDKLQTQMPNLQKEEIADMRNKIEKLQTKLKSHRPSSSLFSRELFQIRDIYKRHKFTSHYLETVLNSWFQKFIEGTGEVELFNRFRNMANELHTLKGNEGKVFVITFVGDVFKTRIKQQLFPNTDNSNVFYLGEYCTATLHKLDKPNSKIDALLVIEMDDLTFIPKSYHRQIELTVAGLKSSNLVICCSTAQGVIRSEFLNALDLSLLISWETSKIQPDFIVATTNEADESIIGQYYRNIFDKLEISFFELGARPVRPFQNALSRIEQNFFHCPTRYSKSGTNVNFNDDDIANLKELVMKSVYGEISAMAQMPIKTLTKALQDLNQEFTTWHKMQTLSFKSWKMLPLKYESFQAMLSDIGEIQTNYDVVRNIFEIAVLNHSIDGKSALQENPVNLEQVFKHLEEAGNPDECKLIGESNVNPCTYCIECGEIYQRFTDKYPQFEESEHNSYVGRLKSIQTARLHTFYSIRSIELNDGITAELESVFEELLPLYDGSNPDDFAEKVWNELVGVYSDGNLNVSIKRLMDFEIEEVYPQAPLIYNEFCTQMDSDLKITFPSDLNYLSRGLELRLKLQDIPVNVLAEFEAQFESKGYTLQFEFGLVRKCRERTQHVLHEYRETYEERIRVDTIWDAHLYVMLLLKRKVAELVSGPGLLEILAKKKPTIVQEILDRLNKLPV